PISSVRDSRRRFPPLFHWSAHQREGRRNAAMLRRRKLFGLLAAAMAVFLALAMGAIPAASADACTVTVTLVGGQTLVFNVNVAPGTPISAMGLAITGPVASESEQCAPATSTTPAVSVTTTSTTSTPTTSSTTPTSSTTSNPSPTSTSTSPSHHGSGSSSSTTTTTSSSTTPVPTGNSK